MGTDEGNHRDGVMSAAARHSITHREDFFSEAGKKCALCGSKWLATGVYVESPTCPFCGGDGAQVIRGKSAVHPVTQQVEQPHDGLTIVAAGRKRRSA